MIRLRRDIDDLDNLFDRNEAQRLRDERAEMIAAGEERLRQEDARDAEARKRATDYMVEANRRMILAEYRAAGVEPRPGPLMSLSLLKLIGWTIADGKLVEPKPQPKYVATGECR